MRKIPLHSLILGIGPYGSHISTILQSKFHNYEILNYEKINYDLFGDSKSYKNDITTSELLHRIQLKLEIGERVVVDSSNLFKKDRLDLIESANRLGCPIFYLVHDRSLQEKENDSSLKNIDLIKKQNELFSINEREILKGDGVANIIDLRKDSFEVINKIDSNIVLEEIKNRGYTGIMVVPDVHGMIESLKNAIDWSNSRNLFLVFLGDVIDYGQHNIECVNKIYDLVTRGKAIFTKGNHEKKIERWFEQYNKGEVKLKLSEGNKITTSQIEALSDYDRIKFQSKFNTLMNFSRLHWVIGDNTLFVHGAAEPEMFNMRTGHLSGKYESMAMFGEIDEVNKFKTNGYPNRIYSWVNRIPQGKRVIVGHDIRSTQKPVIVKGDLGGEAIFMDTGSGKGGKLTSVELIFENDSLEIQSYTFH